MVTISTAPLPSDLAVLCIHHIYGLLSQGGLIHALSCEFLFDLITFFHEEVEKFFGLLLHVLFVFVDKDRFHDKLVETVKVLRAASVNTLVRLSLLVWMEHSLVATVTLTQVDALEAFV